MPDPVQSSAITPKRVDWLWHDRLPKGMIVVVAGKPDQGKGLFAAKVAADISTQGGNVLYSAVEDAEDLMTRPRLEAAGANLDRIWLWNFQVPNQLSELEELIVEHDVRLVVLDPFAAHLGSGVSRHSDNVRQVTTPLKELGGKYGTTFLVMEHALKRVAKNGHPLAAIGGSGSGLPAAARMAYIFGTDPEDSERMVLANVKSNLRERPKAFAFEVDVEEMDVVGEMPSLVVQGETTFDPMRLLQTKATDAKPGPKPDKRAAAAEWLTMHLFAYGPLAAGKLFDDAKAASFTSKTMRRAAEDMGIVKNPPGGGPGTTWDLPPKLRGEIE